MRSQHVEIERKFDVTDATINPSFDGISAVERVEQDPQQTLNAVYFDTPGQRLAQHHITLRQRTGGTDAGWHLKLPAGPDTRTEVRLPLNGVDDAVPEDLRDLVLAVVRQEELSPVARISTIRSVYRLIGPDDRTLAEFCDDRVTATRLADATSEDAQQQWREWELELSAAAAEEGADPALFDRITARLLDAGALPAAHGSKLARVLDSPAPARPKSTDAIQRALLEQLDELVRWDRAVRVDAFDAVHQMRVTIRRIRSLLQSAPQFGANPEPLEELRLLATILGVARDAEVLAQRYRAALAELPPEVVRGPVHERLVDAAQRRYEVGLRRSLAAMRSHRYFRLLATLDELVAHPEPPTAATDAAEEGSMDAAYRKVRRAARAAARAEGEYRDEALHRIRKSAKRLRYVAGASGAKRIALAAKSIQELLGEHQDSAVSRAYLSAQALEAHAAGEDTFTYGLLYQREYDVGEKARRQVKPTLQSLRNAVRHKR